MPQIVLTPFQKNKIKHHESIESLIYHLVHNSTASGLEHLSKKFDIEFSLDSLDFLVSEFTRVVYSYDIHSVEQLKEVSTNR